jgi:hypothetical protein
MTGKKLRIFFVIFLATCFMVAQALPVVALSLQNPCAAMSSGQKTMSQSKHGCCCCNSSHCPCDLKKDNTTLPAGDDFAFDAKAGYQNLEETGFLRERVSECHSDPMVRSLFFSCARAPCPIIYLSTVNLLC